MLNFVLDNFQNLTFRTCTIKGTNIFLALAIMRIKESIIASPCSLPHHTAKSYINYFIIGEDVYCMSSLHLH